MIGTDAIELFKSADLFSDFPVLNEIVAVWKDAKKIRSLGPDSAMRWCDAAKAIKHAKKRISEGVSSTPIKELSGRIFRNTKYLGKLNVQVDVLLSGEIESLRRDVSEIWAEIGLFKHPQMALLAGSVVLERERNTGLIDLPFGGFPVETIRAVKGLVTHVLSIENLTTFHSVAKRECESDSLIIYTAGMPSPAWRSMYGRLLDCLPTDTPIFHWGDVDEGGFRIAATLAKEALQHGKILQAWNMSPTCIEREHTVEASARTIERMQYWARITGWESIALEIVEHGVKFEQETI